MKRWMWLCACAWLSACAVDGTTEVTDEELELGLASSSDVELAAPSDIVEPIDETADVLPPPVCHPETSCPGGTRIGFPVLIDCGAFCTTEVCGLVCDPSGNCQRLSFKQVERQQAQRFSMPDGSECVAYSLVAVNLTCSCEDVVTAGPEPVFGR